MTPHRQGIALCVLSACGFGGMAIFAKEAYGEDVTVLTLLLLRFLMAAAAFWAIVALRGARRPDGRGVVIGLGLGAAGYAGQAGLYFGALTRIDASLTALLLYLYPGLVFVGALTLGREPATPRHALALGLACAGAVLVLLGGSVGALDGVGVAMAVGAATVYAVYILVADRMVGAIDPFVLAALVCTGAAASLGVVGIASGSVHLGLSAAAWGWIAVLALASTVIGISAFFAGLRRVGPSTAAIVSTAEPAVTVGLATAVYGEALGPGQLVGGLLVLTAVVVLQRRVADSVGGDAPPAPADGPAPARTPTHQPA